jgi:membrane protein
VTVNDIADGAPSCVAILCVRSDIVNVAEKAADGECFPMFLDGKEPWHLTREIRFWDVVHLVRANVVADNCVDLAAQMSFYFALALFPFLLILAAIIGWLPFTGLWDEVLEWITRSLPLESQRFVLDAVVGLTHGHAGFLSLGIVATVWSASSGFVSLMESLSLAYDVRDTRSFWRKRAIAVVALFCTVVFCLLAFGLLSLLGPWLGVSLARRFGAHAAFPLGVAVLHWGMAFVLLCAALSILDCALPNVRRPWRIITPGVLVAALSLVGASMMFNFYVKHLASFSATYGTLTASIILITWIYIASLILLIAAETNRVVEKIGAVVTP